MTRIRWYLAVLCCAVMFGAGCQDPADDDAGDDDVADDDDTGDDDDDDTSDDDTGDDDTADDDTADDDTADDDTGDDDDDTGDDDTGDDDTSGPGYHVLEIHLDNLTYDPVGYQEFFFTGSPVALGDAEAVVSAALPGSLVDGCSAVSTHLDFHYCTGMAGDFGGSALVDGRTGNLAFAGSTYWDGTGSLLYPTPLSPAMDLMIGVYPPTIAPTTYEYHLQGLEADSVGDTAMDRVREMDHVLNWVAWGMYDALVYLHPYMVGGYNAAEADLIVVLVM